VYILFPICVSAIGWLLTQVSELDSKVSVLENKMAVVVNAENKAIPPQGTTIELEELRAAAMQSRAELKFEINDRINNIKENAMVERSDIKARISVIEDRLNRRR
jgi:hypothetical protein